MSWLDSTLWNKKLPISTAAIPQKTMNGQKTKPVCCKCHSDTLTGWLQKPPQQQQHLNAKTKIMQLLQSISFSSSCSSGSKSQHGSWLDSCSCLVPQPDLGICRWCSLISFGYLGKMFSKRFSYSIWDYLLGAWSTPKALAGICCWPAWHSSRLR